MVTVPSAADFDPLIATLVRSKAKRLRETARLNRHDLEDLAQDCRQSLLRKLRNYDSARGDLDAYVAKILHHFLLNCFRNRLAARRDPRKVTSLGGPLSASRVPDAARGRGQRPSRSLIEEVDLLHDVSVALEALAPELRALARVLCHQSVSEAARNAGVPRTTVQSRVRKVRRVFEKLMLSEYLTRSSSLRDRTG